MDSDFIIKEFEKLIEFGVYTIKITDEMFLLNPNIISHYVKNLQKKIKKTNSKFGHTREVIQ